MVSLLIESAELRTRSWAAEDNGNCCLLMWDDTVLVLRRLAGEITAFQHHCLERGVGANSISNEFL
jgi:hypothetical protein